MADQPNILDYTDGPLLATGQTVDFTPPGRTTKDDGGFQRGIPGSKLDDQYNILTTGQYSGTTNVTVNAIVDAHTNECVQDKVTGLMWNRETTLLIYGTGAEGLRWDDSAAADEDIFEYCDQANLSNLSGFSDWRVPNSQEIYSLFFNNGAPPYINKTAFPTFTGSITWSSTTWLALTTFGYSMNFGTGGIDTTQKVTRDVTLLCRLGIEV